MAAAAPSIVPAADSDDAHDRLRLGPNLAEVPISAMLVLGLGYSLGAESVGTGRVVETLVGPVEGVLVNIMFPPGGAHEMGGTSGRTAP
jgi:hypothetical protein